MEAYQWNFSQFFMISSSLQRTNLLRERLDHYYYKYVRTYVCMREEGTIVCTIVYYVTILTYVCACNIEPVKARWSCS